MLRKEQLIPLTATPRATDMVKRLVREHGPLALFQSGGCCDGSLPLCLLADDMMPSPNDVLLGEVATVPFYIDAEQYQRWNEPEFLLDVAGGPPEGFSLGLPDAHLVSLSRSDVACQAGSPSGDGPPLSPQRGAGTPGAT
jgi:uncharacterized protein (DUF779 family)